MAQKLKFLISSYFFLVFLTSQCFTMTSGTEQPNKTLGPTYVKPEEGQSFLQGTVHDGRSSFKLEKLSFSGKTSLPGIGNIHDDSKTTINLEQLKEITITTTQNPKENYDSEKFCLVTITPRNGTPMRGFLVPRNIILCGIDSNNLERAWFLHQIEKITLGGEEYTAATTGQL